MAVALDVEVLISPEDEAPYRAAVIPLLDQQIRDGLGGMPPIA